MSKFVTWTFGDVCYRNKNAAMAKKNQVSISHAELVRTSFCYAPGNVDDEEAADFDLNELHDQMMADPERNLLIAQRVKKDADAGHSVLVTSSRVDHCYTLQEYLHKLGVEVAVLTGKRLQGAKTFREDLEKVRTREHRVVIATDQLIREGVNLLPLSRLHVAFPISKSANFEQLCGRICRKHASKADARVCIYCDFRTPALLKRCRKMLAVLQRLKVPNVKDLYIV